MFVDSAGVYGGLNFMLAPNGWDLANNCLVQILERVYGIYMYVHNKDGSVSILYLYETLTLPNCGAQRGSGANLTENHL